MLARWEFASWFVASVAMALFCTGCGSGDSDGPPPAANIKAAAATAPGTAGAADVAPEPLRTENHTTFEPPPAKSEAELYPVVEIETTLGSITVKLNAEKAPITVENFLENYVQRGFYTDTIFHYVEKGYMIAAGGYTSELVEKPARGEILSEADNGLKNARGTIAMARHPEYVNSATSQFFVNLADNDFLDHQDAESSDSFGYCVFGEVIEGMEVVDRIADVEVHDRGDFRNVPVEPIAVKSVRRVR